jgi:hypothetical protein
MKTNTTTTAELLSYPSLQVVDEMPFCQRCRCTLPRSTNDPCRDPQCPLGNMSLMALWKIIEDDHHAPQPKAA